MIEDPTKRPQRQNDGTQTWSHLLFCHWEVPADRLRELLPAPLQLDTFQGRAFVGLVPFQMRAIRPRWFPQRLGINFLETNVRTYVRCQEAPGVYFFSLDANALSAVIAARLGWSLPYYYGRMRHQTDGDLITCRCNRAGGPSSHVVYHRTEHLGPSKPGTLEHFLLERYLMFVSRRGKPWYGHVHHAPYDAYDARVHQCKDGLVSASGIGPLDELPAYAHYCPGVDVEVFGMRELDQL